MTAKVKVERDFGVVEAGSILFQEDIFIIVIYLNMLRYMKY